jgi:hypothetical protein
MEDSHRKEEVHVSDADRETAARRLAHAASAGQINSDELQTRLSRIHQAHTYADLRRLLRDLPGGEDPVERTLPEHTVPETMFISAPLRSARKKGPWKVPQKIVASSGLGSVHLDFTNAVNEHDQVVVEARPNWRDIELIVPECYAVSAEEAVPGALDMLNNRAATKALSGAPKIHVVARLGQGQILIRNPRKRRRLRPGPRAARSTNEE